MEEKIVSEFKKNTREVVRTSIKTWNGQELFDLRVCYMDKDGRMKPGPKGLCLRTTNLAELQEALARVSDELTRGGRPNENA